MDWVVPRSIRQVVHLHGRVEKKSSGFVPKDPDAPNAPSPSFLNISACTPLFEFSTIGAYNANNLVKFQQNFYIFIHPNAHLLYLYLQIELRGYVHSDLQDIIRQSVFFTPVLETIWTQEKMTRCRERKLCLHFDDGFKINHSHRGTIPSRTSLKTHQPVSIILGTPRRLDIFHHICPWQRKEAHPLFPSRRSRAATPHLEIRLLLLELCHVGQATPLMFFHELKAGIHRKEMGSWSCTCTHPTHQVFITILKANGKHPHHLSFHPNSGAAYHRQNGTVVQTQQRLHASGSTPPLQSGNNGSTVKG
ncbi:hypothetical protein BJ508DRAFT_347054 [Ascobolus immersus RN42]|uniref:Uncharacterized protein n=1 Tax=Ascobolus immersus RN42 TaxID=1160509 RepID=A0A3N4I8H7_ASCIM|nr:hypothetical protein BJ508DRAFT_347054 [Ascobolus immersus RN42]